MITISAASWSTRSGDCPAYKARCSRDAVDHALQHREHGRVVDSVRIAGAARLDILVLELGQDHPQGRGGAGSRAFMPL